MENSAESVPYKGRVKDMPDGATGYISAKNLVQEHVGSGRGKLYTHANTFVDQNGGVRVTGLRPDRHVSILVRRVDNKVELVEPLSGQVPHMPTRKPVMPNWILITEPSP